MEAFAKVSASNTCLKGHRRAMARASCSVTKGNMCQHAVAKALSSLRVHRVYRISNWILQVCKLDLIESTAFAEHSWKQATLQGAHKVSQLNDLAVLSARMAADDRTGSRCASCSERARNRGPISPKFKMQTLQSESLQVNRCKWPAPRILWNEF